MRKTLSVSTDFALNRELKQTMLVTKYFPLFCVESQMASLLCSLSSTQLKSKPLIGVLLLFSLLACGPASNAQGDCGNEVVDPGEACDDGNQNDGLPDMISLHSSTNEVKVLFSGVNLE
jgi:hypothetical protein